MGRTDKERSIEGKKREEEERKGENEGEHEGGKYMLIK